MLFTKTKPTDGRAEVSAATANYSGNFSAGDVGMTASTDGAYLGWGAIDAQDKQRFTIRVKSQTGGTLTVFETGVGDKILCAVSLPTDGEWHEITVDCRDTDADPSPIYLSFAAEGDALDVSVDWFRFE